MTQLQLEFWSLVISAVSTLMVVIAAFAGAIKYFQERARDRKAKEEELAWRKTHFILELSRDFEKDIQYQTVWRLLSYGIGLPKNSTLNTILGDIAALNAPELRLRYAIDGYLDFFDRLYHFTFVTRSLNVSDIEVFGWYITQICETKEVCVYAKTSGFEDVLKLGAELRKLFGRSHWYKTIHKYQATRRPTAARKVNQ